MDIFVLGKTYKNPSNLECHNHFIVLIGYFSPQDYQEVIKNKNLLDGMTESDILIHANMCNDCGNLYFNMNIDKGNFTCLKDAEPEGSVKAYSHGKLFTFNIKYYLYIVKQFLDLDNGSYEYHISPVPMVNDFKHYTKTTSWVTWIKDISNFGEYVELYTVSFDKNKKKLKCPIQLTPDNIKSFEAPVIVRNFPGNFSSNKDNLTGTLFTFGKLNDDNGEYTDITGELVKGDLTEMAIFDFINNHALSNSTILFVVKYSIDREGRTTAEIKDFGNYTLDISDIINPNSIIRYETSNVTVFVNKSDKSQCFDRVVITPPRPSLFTEYASRALVSIDIPYINDKPCHNVDLTITPGVKFKKVKTEKEEVKMNKKIVDLVEIRVYRKRRESSKTGSCLGKETIENLVLVGEFTSEEYKKMLEQGHLGKMTDEDNFATIWMEKDSFSTINSSLIDIKNDTPNYYFECLIDDNVEKDLVIYRKGKIHKFKNQAWIYDRLYQIYKSANNTFYVGHDAPSFLKRPEWFEKVCEINNFYKIITSDDLVNEKSYVSLLKKINERLPMELTPENVNPIWHPIYLDGSDKDMVVAVFCDFDADREKKFKVRFFDADCSMEVVNKEIESTEKLLSVNVIFVLFVKTTDGETKYTLLNFDNYCIEKTDRGPFAAVVVPDDPRSDVLSLFLDNDTRKLDTNNINVTQYPYTEKIVVDKEKEVFILELNKNENNPLYLNRNFDIKRKIPDNLRETKFILDCIWDIDNENVVLNTGSVRPKDDKPCSFYDHLSKVFSCANENKMVVSLPIFTYMNYKCDMDKLNTFYTNIIGRVDNSSKQVVPIGAVCFDCRKDDIDDFLDKMSYDNVNYHVCRLAGITSISHYDIHINRLKRSHELVFKTRKNTSEVRSKEYFVGLGIDGFLLQHSSINVKCTESITEKDAVRALLNRVLFGVKSYSDYLSIKSNCIEIRIPSSDIFETVNTSPKLPDESLDINAVEVIDATSFFPQLTIKPYYVFVRNFCGRPIAIKQNCLDIYCDDMNFYTTTTQRYACKAMVEFINFLEKCETGKNSTPTHKDIRIASDDEILCENFSEDFVEGDRLKCLILLILSKLL